jgi:hypothetical protein
MGGVRRILTFGLAWLAAAVTASVIAWQGVSLIGAQVTDSRPETLSAGDIEAELAEPASPTDGPTGADGGTTATASTAATGTDDPNGTAPTGTATTAPPTTAATVETQTVRMTGGTAAFEFSDGSVRLLYASPNPGYRWERKDSDNGGVRVEFKGDEGTSRVEAWWDGGPQIERDENDSHGDDD